VSWERSEDACWWVRWACVSGDIRIGWVTEVGVYKSANKVCIIKFAVGVLNSLFLFLEFHGLQLQVHSRREID